MLSVFFFSFQEKLVEMVVNTVEYIDKIAYSLMKSIGENVSCHKNYPPASGASERSELA